VPAERLRDRERRHRARAGRDLVCDVGHAPSPGLDAGTRARPGGFFASLPAGLDTHVGDDGLKLSAAERQRVALARVFLKDAPILVLDEATSHLDAATEAEVLDAVDAFAAARTLLVVAHGTEPPRLAARVTSLPGR
jgi:ABC-type multidrug transport system fused ATPase/permease subunit